GEGGEDYLLASAYNHLELYKWLYEIGIEAEVPIRITYEINHFLNSQGVSGSTTLKRCTPFTFFCRNGNLKAIKWLYNCKEPIFVKHSSIHKENPFPGAPPASFFFQ
ncbi:unnamed protein product, partial [marine sediment metagenome]